MAFRDKLGRMDVETSSGSCLVQRADGQCLFRSVDPWGDKVPGFDHADFALRFTPKQAAGQIDILRRVYKVQARAVDANKARNRG